MNFWARPKPTPPPASITHYFFFRNEIALNLWRKIYHILCCFKLRYNCYRCGDNIKNGVNCLLSQTVLSLSHYPVPVMALWDSPPVATV